jgi:lysozyme
VECDNGGACHDRDPIEKTEEDVRTSRSIKLVGRARLVALFVFLVPSSPANQSSERDYHLLLLKEEMTMTTSKQGIDLIKRFETFQSKPYRCPGGYATIGYGSTFYEDGTRVTLNDPPLGQPRAESLLLNVLKHFEVQVDSVTRDDITQHQFDALVSFCFNVGADSLKRSTLLRKVNTNPNDPTIRTEFRRWVYANGKRLLGLLKRREAEWQLYSGAA